MREAFQIRTEDLKPGDIVRVHQGKRPGRRGPKGRQKIKHGTVLKVYDRFILLQLPGWKESFLIPDIIAGYVRIELLEGRKAI